ncbi:MAG: hypothetical protein QM674_10560 [Burkholderiaceae bacterium]
MRFSATAVRSHRRARRAGRAALAGLAIVIALPACQHVPSGESRSPQDAPVPSQGRGDDGALESAVATMRSRAQPAPAWMVGSFVGTSLRSGLRNIAIDVAADGGIRGRVGDLQAQGQYIGASRILWAHGNESIVERRGSGFRVMQVKDPANVIEYQRR